MLINTFRSNQPVTLLFALLVGVVLLVPGASVLQAPGPQGAMPLYGLLHGWLSGLPWATTAVVLLVVLLMIGQVNDLNETLSLSHRRDHVVALLFPLLLATLPGGLPAGPALFGAPLVLGAMRRTWLSYGASPARGAIFDAGFLVGLAALFHLPHALMLLVIWASLALMRPFRWREYVLAALGMALPFYFAWAALWLVDGGPMSPLTTMVGEMAGSPAVQYATPHLMALVVWAAIMLIAMHRFSAAYQQGVVREKNLRAAFLAFLAVCLVLTLAGRLLNGSWDAMPVALALSLMLAQALRPRRRTWPADIAVLLLLGLGFWAQWSA